MVEIQPRDASMLADNASYSHAINLADIDPVNLERFDSGYSEFNTVLGGGIVPNSVVLIGGEPGIGKSTLLLEVAGSLGAMGKKVLYYSGEESASQIKLRAKRLEINEERVFLLTVATLEDLQKNIAVFAPDFLIVDSIQTLSSAQISTVPGSPSSLRTMTAEIIKISKRDNLTAFIIGHITKEGQIAGPKILEHMVDAVLYFQGDAQNDLRILRAEKNRFGSVNEIGVFQMTANGLKQIADPTQAFLQNRGSWASGIALFPAMNGLRSMLTEVQSLVADTPLIGNPRRIAIGFDSYRMAMLISIIEKKLQIPFYKSDAFLNIAGGLVVRDPACDLAVCAALVSSHRNMALPQDAVFLGEVGLTGEIRPVSQLERRLKEAVRHGINRVFLPSRQAESLETTGLSACGDIRELFQLLKEESRNDLHL